MNINRQNIELLFFEYFEGNLSSDEIKELFLFLDKNPDLKEQFDSYVNIKLSPDATIRFEKKESLKKPTENDIDIFELHCIRYIENDLNEDEKMLLFQQISENTEKQKIFDSYRRTILKPKDNIEYLNKDLLKKNDLEFEERCIEHLEGTLNNAETKKLLSEINKDQHKKLVFELYKKTKLEPDYTLIFNKKETLKKGYSTTIYSLKWILSAAASIILIVYVALNFSKNEKLNSIQVAENNKLNPLNIRAVYHNFIVKNDDSFIHKHKKIQKNIPQVNEFQDEQHLVQENTIKVDSIETHERPIIINENKQIAENKPSFENDSLANEVLNKLFAQNKFNYFHQMITDVSNEKQAYLPNHKGSWWNVLENGTNFISEHTNSKVSVKEYKYEDNQRVKQEITLGNFSFSRSISKK